jgi:hypothetical protein
LQKEIRTEILRVKGTRHYNAKAAFSAGELGPGADILLVPEPQNPHDKNAVAVLSSKRKMLGHISRDVAAKYQLLCFENKIIQVKVHSATASDDHALLDIRFSVTHNRVRHSFSQETTLLVLPNSPGTYEISLQCGPTYIGATSNLRRRYAQHLNELQNQTHRNKVLQADFNISGSDSLTFKVLRSTSTKAQAEDFESFEIMTRLKNGEPLYNKTLDGKGISPKSTQSSNTISDVFNRNYALSTQLPNANNETSNNFSAKRVKSRDVSQSNSVLPKTSLLTTIQANGGTYEGTFLDGQLTGRGKYTSKNGDTYEGELVDGALTGKGKYTFANGDTYEGSFHNGRRRGEGKFIRNR